jgi:hypothetical protein
MPKLVERLQGQMDMMPWAERFLKELKQEAQGAEATVSSLELLPEQWLSVRNMLSSGNHGNDIDRMILLSGMASLVKHIRWVSPEELQRRCHTSTNVFQQEVSRAAEAAEQELVLGPNGALTTLRTASPSVEMPCIGAERTGCSPLPWFLFLTKCLTPLQHDPCGVR